MEVTQRSAKLTEARFAFATCQIGAEGALKAEVARLWPDLRFAFSRPGFLTFKLPIPLRPIDAFSLEAVFARSSGLSLGKVGGATVNDLAEAAWQLLSGLAFDRVHVYERDSATIGFRGFEPSVTETCAQLAFRMCATAPFTLRRGKAEAGERVLDCVLVEPGELWLGAHVARSVESRWPGGIYDLALPTEAISRAWLKMNEALDWSELPIQPNEILAELGCAPGGASQALLERGVRVVGIDPADVDPRAAEHKDFTHIRKRGADVRRREFRGVRWLSADINVAPSYTLDAVEAIVLHPTVDIAGLLLTLKLPDWALADELPSYLNRIEAWGYGRTVARQLSHNRQEVCVAARRKAKRG